MFHDLFVSCMACVLCICVWAGWEAPVAIRTRARKALRALTIDKDPMDRRAILKNKYKYKQLEEFGVGRLVIWSWVICSFAIWLFGNLVFWQTGAAFWLPDSFGG